MLSGESINLNFLLKELENTKFNVYFSEIKYWVLKFQFGFKITGILIFGLLLCYIESKIKIVSCIFGSCRCLSKLLKCCQRKKKPEILSAPTEEHVTKPNKIDTLLPNTPVSS